MNFEPHPRQKEFFGNPRRRTFLPLRAGQRGGRTAAIIAMVRAEAINEEEAELAIDDLRGRGYCLMRDGRRVESPESSSPKIVFDEVDSPDPQ